MQNPLPKFSNIGAWLEHWTGVSPDKVAFVFQGEDSNDLQSITYQQLLNRTHAIAAQLIQSNKPGDRVILTYQPGLEFIAAFLGCIQARLIAVPVYPPTSPKDWPRFVKIVLNSDARCVCTTTNLAQLAQAGIAMTPQLSGLQITITDQLQDTSGTQVPCTASTDTIAFLQYTSGSTGNPKGVILTHGNLFHNECLIKESLHANQTSKAVCWLPQYHDMGLIGNILGVLFNGSSSTLMSPLTFLKQPYRWLKAISDDQATISGGPNFAYELCVKRISEEQRATLDLSSWALAYNGAEPIRASTLSKFNRAFADCGFQQKSFTPLYGLAESSLLVTHHPMHTPLVTLDADCNSLARGTPQQATDTRASKTLVASGQAIGQTLRIVNPETGALCGEQEVGEVWVQGDSVAQGYWKNPETTTDTFQAFLSDTGEGPFMRTGDLGFLQGPALFITGRLKEMMIVDGRNLYPQDIEETLQATHPAFRIGCGAVFSLEDESVVAVQELSNRTELSQDELAALVQTALRNINQQHQLALKNLVLIEQGSLQKTSSGKIRRSAMAQLYEQDKLKTIGQYAPKDFLKPASQTERPTPSLSHSHYEAAILDVVATTTGINANDINPATTFSDFGLDSKTLVGMAGDLETRLKQPLPTQLFFDYPSIARLAAHLSGQTEAPAADPTHPPQTRHTRNGGDIAIVGIGCRLPGKVESPDAFWQLLESGQDAITETPISRWNNRDFYDADILAPGKMTTRWGGYLHREKDFDAAFFDIKEKEATLLDPQQRLLLETSWHALEHAGIPPGVTAGRDVGVFVGISNVDYDRHCSKLGACSDPYAGTGNATSIAANRLSYFYDWRGPSVAVDTACSSSLVALHQACQSLQQRECELALAAGVNLILSPELSITFSKSGMMAADGRCKTFDDSADGYVRAEGCSVLILKSLEQAQRDNDNIIAVIKGSAITQDGRSNGITAPNGPAQVKTIQKALANAGLTAQDVQYVESHGTGTALGDPIELQALTQAYGTARSDKLLIGSVKTNIGHLESAAGITGVIKAALALHKQRIPSNLHFNTPNRRFDWSQSQLDVVCKNIPWLVPTNQKRRAGVSSFGFGGTNAHLILEEAPQHHHTSKPEHQGSPALFCLSAKDRSSLQSIIREYVRYLDQTDVEFTRLVHSQNCTRTHFNERLAIKCDSIKDLRERLSNINWAKPESGVFSSRRRTQNKRHTITWMFTGQGTQHLGMGRELYHRYDAFKASIDQCHDLLRQQSDIELKPFILEGNDDTKRQLIDRTDYTQPVLFCFEYSLAQILLQAGLRPDTLLGHSLGEIVAATIAGVFTLADGIRVATTRGRLMQQLEKKGGMMAVFAHKEDVLPLLKDFPLVSIGALNGPGQIVLSGCEQSLHSIETDLMERDIETRHINVSHGFHSPLMEPMLPAFREELQRIPMAPPRYSVISNVTASPLRDELATVDYWCQHITAAVNFQGSLHIATENQQTALIEIGPKPTLSALAKRTLGRDSAHVIPLIQNPEEEHSSLLDALARSYTLGINFDWSQILQSDAQMPRVDLPLYAFQRKYFWLTGSVSRSTQAVTEQQDADFHPLLGKRQHSPYLKSGELHFIAYPGLDPSIWAGTFKQNNIIHFHLSHFLEMALEVGHTEFQTTRLNILDLELHQRMSITRGEIHSIHTIAERRASNEIRIQFYSQNQQNDNGQDQWALLCSVSVSNKISTRLPTLEEIRLPESLHDQAPAMENFFNTHKLARTHYCTNEKNGILSTQIWDNGLICSLDFSELMASSTNRLWFKPEAIQGLYQIVGFFCESMRTNKDPKPGIEFTPCSARNIVWANHLSEKGHAYLHHVSAWSDDAEYNEIDLHVFDENGQLSVRIEGLLLKSRIRNTLSLSEKIRTLALEERIIIIRNLIADSFAANLGGQAMDIDMSQSLAELGVDSITVITALSLLKNELNIDISAGDIHRARSIENFAILLATKLGNPESIVTEQETTMRGTCAVLREGHAGVLPLFIIHPGNDGALHYLDLANAFGDEIPLYAMLPEICNADQEPAHLKEVVLQLTNDIRNEQPHGPYMLASWSLGSTLAIMVANHLAKLGEEIKFVSVIDAPCLSSSISLPELDRCIDLITDSQSIMGIEHRDSYKARLQALYRQALNSKPLQAPYELKHFQSESTSPGALPYSSVQDWSAITSRKIHSQTIPGDHNNLFKSGNVETLASFLRRQIRSCSSTANRFLLDSIDRNGVAQSVLQGKPERDENNNPSAQLLLDENHPYFFDHELDHIPGILILAGAWELVCRSTQEIDPLNPVLARRVSNCSLIFDRFAEKNEPLHYELICTGGNPHRIDLECRVKQARQRIGTLHLQLDYSHKKPMQIIPASRQILSSGFDLLHKQIESNVLINQPVRTETRWECHPQMPESGHYLSHTTLGYGCLNPIYILETTRQFLTYLSHDQFGVEMGTNVNLVDISLEFSDVIDFSKDVQLILTPQTGIVERDAFQTITVLWQQSGRTVANSRITAQVTRKETYHKQRAR